MTHKPEQKPATVPDQIAEEAQRLLDDLALAQAFLAEGDLEQAWEVLGKRSKLLVSDARALEVMRNLRVKSALAAPDQATVAGDSLGAAKHFEELEAEPFLDAKARKTLVAAKIKIADLAVKSEIRYKNAEAALAQMDDAVKKQNVEPIPALLEKLGNLEKDLRRDYPSSDLVAKLVARSRQSRQNGAFNLLDHEFRKMIVEAKVRKAGMGLKQITPSCNAAPENGGQIPQLQCESAVLEDALSALGVAAPVQPPLEREPVLEPEPSAEPKPLPGFVASLPGELPDSSPSEPVLAEGLGAELVTKDERAGLVQTKPGNEPMSMEALRRRVKDLLEYNSERCLAFLGTLEPRASDDPVIKSYYQQAFRQALQSRKAGNSELVVTKAKRGTQRDLEGPGILCPVCGTMNDLDSTGCSQCHADVQGSQKAAAASPPAAKVIFSFMPPQPGRGKQGLGPVARFPEPIHVPFKTQVRGTAKYYLALALAIVLVAAGGYIGFGRFWPAGNDTSSAPTNKTKQQEPAQAPLTPIGTAELAVDITTQSGGTLAKGTQVEILRQPEQLPQAPVQIRPGGENGSQQTVQLEDLALLNIPRNIAFTFWHAQNTFPAADPTSLAMKEYLDFIDPLAKSALNNPAAKKPSDNLIFQIGQAHYQIAKDSCKFPDKAADERATALFFLLKVTADLKDQALALSARAPCPVRPLPATLIFDDELGNGRRLLTAMTIRNPATFADAQAWAKRIRNSRPNNLTADQTGQLMALVDRIGQLAEKQKGQKK